MLTAIVNGNGKRYKDGTELLYLHVKKVDGRSLPYHEGKRVPITLVVGDKEYAGTLGARRNYPYIYIAPGLLDAQGVPYKLAYVLHSAGLSKGDRRRLLVSGSRISVE